MISNTQNGRREVLSASLVQPAVRMTALFAYSKEEAGEVTAHFYTEPVLCIQAVVRHGEEVFLDAVISGEDRGLTTVDDVLAEATNLVGTVVPTQ